MNRLGMIVLWTLISAVAVTIFFKASAFSRRYNAWTTALRTKYPRINPPPSEQARRLNETTMTWMFRILAAFLAWMAFWALFRLRFLS